MHFVKALILTALPTIVDLGTDSFSAEKFITQDGWQTFLTFRSTTTASGQVPTQMMDS